MAVPALVPVVQLAVPVLRIYALAHPQTLLHIFHILAFLHLQLIKVLFICKTYLNI